MGDDEGGERNPSEPFDETRGWAESIEVGGGVGGGSIVSFGVAGVMRRRGEGEVCRLSDDMELGPATGSGLLRP